MATGPNEEMAAVWRKEDALALMLEIIGELAPGEGEVVPSARLIEDLGYHSLALLELAFSLEDEFDLATIDETTARKINLVQHVIDHVINELAGKGALV